MCNRTGCVRWIRKLEIKLISNIQLKGSQLALSVFYVLLHNYSALDLEREKGPIRHPTDRFTLGLQLPIACLGHINKLASFK